MSNEEFVGLIKETIYNGGFVDGERPNIFTKKTSKQAPTQQIMINGQLIQQQPKIIQLDYNIELYNESTIEDENSITPFILVDFNICINDSCQSRRIESIYYDELELFKSILNNMFD